jgi:hypothetical protein
MSKLVSIMARERRLWQQKRDIQVLQAEIARLRTQNERMRTAMRRCVTCDYRLQAERAR